MKKSRATKYLRIAEMLENRLRRGDYSLKKLPSECDLAEEVGVSRMTARKALLHLIEVGVLARRRYGRLEVTLDSGGRKKVSQFAFLMPATVAGEAQIWQWGVERAAQRLHGVLRPIIYADWNDVLIPDVLRGFDGVFLMQAGIDVPAQAQDILSRTSARVVSLDFDMSETGMPSVWLFPPKCVYGLLNYLKNLGHRRIGCLNTSPLNSAMKVRMQDYQEWCRENSIDEKLLNNPVDIFTTPDSVAIQARERVTSLLDNKTFGLTALVCTNVWSAMGAMRAVHKHGLEVGKDISICCVNDERLASWTNPTLTSLRMYDPESLLMKCMNWMAGLEDWTGPKLLVPPEIPLLKGDSTAPVPE